MIKLALRNVLRQKTRMRMTLAAIAFGVVSLILAGGFIQDIFVQLGESIIHSQTGHLQVFRKGFLEKGTRYPERYLIDKPEILAQKIASNPMVDAVMSRLYFSGLANNGRRDLAIIGEGVEPDKEAKLGSFLKITAGRQLSDHDRDGILIGQGVANSLAVKPGDRLSLVSNTAEGATNTLDFEVIGVFQSFSKEFDARAVRIPIAAAQELLASTGANQLVVSLKDTSDTDLSLTKLTKQLSDLPYEIRSWRTLSDFFDKSVKLYESQFGILKLIILLMVLLSVVNSVNMSIFERQNEIGTMRAVGTRSSTVFRLIMTESVIVGMAGALFGMTLGCGASWLISSIGIPMPPPPNANIGYTAIIRLVPTEVASVGFVGFIATCLATIFPAYRASRLPITDALRHGV